ncbi:glutamate 5-kinase [Legionella birminghamensis]|uniref:Glutamate 5-kinase n=1 Tax=Legionella birminghamensis TaxID=28083 RepID=A0A378ICH2_9GAMM|nr:glutamate 5-kinase [Legionella birminghamensis]KTC66740.1 glutamate 5-kinase [Legionella birminghamensis]STX32889.1 glutamate 5-kinase [Legionella birminghamensis]
MIIVIKVGTQSILTVDGTLNEPVMRHLVEQIAHLQAQGNQLVLVSSGAVGAGRKISKDYLARQYGHSIAEKQVLASIGQPELMKTYSSLFKTHTLLTAQLLLTRQDFHTRQHYLNIARLIREILNQRNIIPIINENDSVAIEELMFTDNDELAGLIAAQINADKLIVLSNIAGVFSHHPDNPEARLIPVIKEDSDWPAVSSLKSNMGRGGMLSKLSTARKMSQLGITSYIASLDQQNIILRILAGEALGTTILPRKNTSNIKKWMAYNADKPNGVVLINKGLFDIIKDGNRVISLLPVGIEDCLGEFKKGDLVEILFDNIKIGIGIARYDARKLQEFLGKKNKPEFIHYDHLHIY